MIRHFLQENDFSQEEVIQIFASAYDLKSTRSQRPTADLGGQSWGMMFYKQSTRTRVFLKWAYESLEEIH